MFVLFHGHGACKCGLIREAKAFHDLGCECLLVDFRAGGGSTGDVCTLGVAEADDVAATVRTTRELAPNLPVILFGQSMGGAAVLRSVAHFQVQADGLIIESTFDRLYTTAQHRFELMGLPSFPMARLLVFWGGAQHGFNAFTHDPVEYARHVTTPTLLMHGDRDVMVHTDEAKAIFATLAGPKTFHLFPNAGHESYLFRSPKEWTELVEQFLSDKSK
jgi:alpha-beta hydrolase superfamily lysophospholipase